MTLLLQYGIAFASAIIATAIAYALVRHDFLLPLLARVVPAKWLSSVWIVLVSALVAIVFTAGWPRLPAISLPTLPRLLFWNVLVVLALIVIFFIGLWSGINTWWRYERAKRQSLELVGALSNLLVRGEYEQAVEMTKHYRRSHLAKVIAAGLLEFEATRRDNRIDPELAVEAAGSGMDRTATSTVAELKENLGVLATVGATAPFVGLFGTVVGIINAFTGMAKGGGGIASVSAGIAEALLTTAGGLLVAIPAVWAYNYFLHRVDRFTVEMANTRSQLLSRLTKESAERDRVRVH